MEYPVPFSLEQITVTTPQKSYPIYIGSHLLAHSTLLQPLVAGKQAFILTQSNVAAYYLSTLKETCHQAGAAHIEALCLPEGEQYKNLDTVNKIWSTLLSQQYKRDMVFITLGGGMIGDLGGFAAACYLRGVQLIHFPTTLLAQIDAAIGGKTGVNHSHGKNLIGAYYHPAAVISDLETLHTLSQREFVAGLAEIIKYGLALDDLLFLWLEKNISAVLQREPQAIQKIISWGASLKAKIIDIDAKDTAERLLLNFGHTVGHAIESLLAYEQLLHGEAVAIGMVAATQLSIAQGNLAPNILERLIFLLNAANLPIKLPVKLTVTQILTKMKYDKKHMHQRWRWILLHNLGKAFICEEVTQEQITTALMICGAQA